MKVTKFLILTALILGGLVSAFGLTINNLSPAPKYEAANLLDSFTNSENFGITNFLNSNPGNDSLVPQAGRPDIAWMRGGPVSISQGQRTIYSPNGQMVAVYNGVQVKVHRVSDGLLLLTVNSIANGFDCQNPQMAPSFAFSPDSQKLVTMVDAPQPVGKAIQFWNLSNRTLESSITASGNSGVAFSPDGTKLIAGRSIYKVSDGTLLFFFPLGRYPAFYSPNGQFIYGSTYDTCSSSVNFAEFNGSTYSFIRNIGAGAGTPQTISPDGRYLINNYPGDVIQVSDGSVIASLGASGPNPYHTYTFSPNGQYVAIGRAFYRQLGQDPILIIRRTSDWSIVRSYNVDETVAMTDPGVVAAAFSPDSATVATTTWDTKLWSVADGSFIKGLSPIYASGVNAVAFSPDGQTIATATSETAGRLLSNIQLWNTADGSRKNINFLQTQGANISQVIFTPNGQNLLTFGGGNGQFSLQLWNANTGAFVRNYTFAGNGPIALSPDGQTIAVGNSGSAYNFYRLSDGTSLPFSISSAGGSGVYSPDGQIFAAYGGDFKMKLFNANNGAFIREITTGASANGGGPSRFPGCTSFSPDGTMIGIATEETNNFPRSGFIKLYRVSDGTLIRSLGQFDNWAACFTFTKDNQYVIATGWDATVRIWRISDGAQLQTYTSETGFQPGSNYALGQIALSPDGSKFAYVRADAAFVLASNPYYTPPTYSISGTITRNGSPLSGAAVALTGASSANATTDASGNYSFTNLASGNYTVTPSLANHSFAPGLISFSPLSTNQTTANFAATLNCTYSLTPSSPQSVGAAASTLNVTVTTPAGCAWTAASNSAFLTVTGGTSGNQTGTVNISIAANTGAARSGTLTIAGQTYTINQPDGTQPCTYTLNPTSASVSNAAGGGSFGVSTQAGCQWSAQSSSSFLTTNSTGTGPGTVNYSYAANSGAARSATITVGGQTFTLNQAAGTTNCPTCVAVSLPAVNASQNTTVTVPVTVGDTTGRGITAFDFDLRFDSSIVRPLAAQPVDNAGTVSSNFTITPNAGTAGRLVVSGFGINPLAGAGTLLNLKFEVIGSAQQVAALTWQTFQFNEGDPAAAPTPGQITVVNGSIAGAINYHFVATGGTPKPMANIPVTGAGTPQVSATTNAAGAYLLNNFGSGAYTVTPSKTGDVNGISSLDASRVAQFAAGLVTLTPNQQIAADTTNNGSVSSLDASRLAQYVAGIPNTGITGQWKFAPAARNYPSVTTQLTGENYDAILVGEVTGNWTAPASLTDGKNEAEAKVEVSGTTREASPDAVAVSLPHLNSQPAATLTIPVTVGDLSGQNVTAYDFDLRFDPNVLQLVAGNPVSNAGTLSSGFTITPNPNTPGKLIVSAFGIAPLSGSGTLLNLNFQVIGQSGASSPLTWQMFTFNEGDPQATTANGSVTLPSACSYSLAPTSASVISSGGAGSFGVTAGSGCEWTAATTANWIQITNGTGTGNGTVNFTVNANPPGAADRTGTITVGGQTFTVNQVGGCQWQFSPSIVNAPAAGGSQTASVGTRAGCDFRPFLSTQTPWISNIVSDISNQTITFQIAANTGAARTGTISIGATALTVNQAAGVTRRSPYDFDGDGKTDVSIFRPSDGSWWYLRSQDVEFRVFRFGVGSDVIAPGDYTGDGKADLCVFRAENATWYIQRSEDNSYFSFPFGAAGDIPAPADYDADGKTDAAVFRPSTGTWYILNSGGSGTSIVPFGTAEDKPVVADYDGDGRADIAVFRPSDGSWWYLRSSDAQFRVYRFGVGTDKAVPGDYTGDGKADLAVFRPATGEWFVQRSEDNSYFSFPFGIAGDIPAPGDYDGDGKMDATVVRPSNNTWYMNQTSSGVGIVTFGSEGDLPVPNAFVP